MNKIAQIQWEPTVFPLHGEINGIVNGNLMFAIDRKGIKKITYTLFSFPFRNNLFVRANNKKKLMESEDLELLKTTAQKLLEKHVQSCFLEAPAQ